MHHFDYRNGRLFAEDVDLGDIADQVGTPFYCYSSATLTRHYEVFKASFGALNTLVCYAVKANSNLAVLTTLARAGAGADVVSAGEMDRALKAGIPARRIVFSGVGKSADEMARALKAGIHQFNVESEPELECLSRVASSLGLTADITFRINPDVDAKTHAKISTGKAENKFGINWTRAHAIYARAAELPGINPVGVDVHIGSQLTELAPFEAAFERVVTLFKDLRAAGHKLTRIDLGGGLGIPYEAGKAEPPLPAAYGAMVQKVIGDLDVEIILEPGRLIVGNAGVLVSEVVYVKEGDSRSFVILDAAMNDLVRPAMYDAHHELLTLNEPTEATPMVTVDVVGPVCETGDTFARGREMPAVVEGDRVAFMSAGAYGAVMSMTYNSRPLVPEVLVNGSHYAVVRRRVTPDEILALDQVPDWLGNGA